MMMKCSEILDRWTILLMKAKFSDLAKKELDVYNFEVNGILHDSFKDNEHLELVTAISYLMEANSKIWLLEASIRKEFSSDPQAAANLTLEEVGRRAIQIREFNAKRIAAKKDIDKIFGEIVDEKVDHISAKE